MMKESSNNVTSKQVQQILEGTHVRYLGNGMVELTHGIDKCVRKVHRLPEHIRTEE